MSPDAVALRDARRRVLSEMYERVALHRGDEVADVLRMDPDVPQMSDGPTLSIEPAHRIENMTLAAGFEDSGARRVREADGDPMIFAVSAAAHSMAQRGVSAVDLSGGRQRTPAAAQVASSHTFGASGGMGIPLIRDVRIVRDPRQQGGLPRYGERGGLPDPSPVAPPRGATAPERGKAL